MGQTKEVVVIEFRKLGGALFNPEEAMQQTAFEIEPAGEPNRKRLTITCVNCRICISRTSLKVQDDNVYQISVTGVQRIDSAFVGVVTVNGEEMEVGSMLILKPTVKEATAS